MRKPSRPWEQMKKSVRDRARRQKEEDSKESGRPAPRGGPKSGDREGPAAKRKGGKAPQIGKPARQTQPARQAEPARRVQPARTDRPARRAAKRETPERPPEKPATSRHRERPQDRARRQRPRTAPERTGPARATAAATASDAKVATYRLLIEYEGTRYSGWQEQKNASTVMGSLLRAIQDAGFPLIDFGGAGRTDAGVHALAQCAHLRLAQRVDPAEICRALNKRLPRDVHVLAAAAAAPSFHARHDAVARSYLYQISRRRTALAKPWVWWVRDPLDIEALRAAALRITGRHDFRNFAESDPSTADSSTLVEVETVEVAEEGALILVRIVASHFLWKMVRRLIGTLAQVGAGHLAAADLDRLLAGAPLAAGDPHPAQWTAPPSGLFLERVLYPGDSPLQAIAAVTKVLAEPGVGPRANTARRPVQP